MENIEKNLIKEINEVIKLLSLIKKQKNRSFSNLCKYGIKTINKKGKIIFFGNGGSFFSGLSSLDARLGS